jgi:tripartite-type tricarboxylate transporter receptor subunit TctC
LSSCPTCARRARRHSKSRFDAHRQQTACFHFAALKTDIEEQECVVANFSLSRCGTGGPFAGKASAQNWPDKPVKLILPYAPGGGTDLIGRPWAEKLSQSFGQQFIIENRGGAGGMIGSEAAAKAAPRRLHLFAHAQCNAQRAAQPAQDPPRSQKLFAGGPGWRFRHRLFHASGGRTEDFQRDDRVRQDQPGKLSYGSAGLGTATHLRIEMLKYRAGIDILHVPYRGSADALNDHLPNTLQMMNEINTIPHVKAGKLLLLNINNATRHADFPDVPTLTECGYANSDVPIWYSLFAPAGTPKAIVAKLNAKIVEIANSEEMRDRMRSINTCCRRKRPRKWSPTSSKIPPATSS